MLHTVAPHAVGLSWLDPTNLLANLGPYALLGAALIIFAECGLLIGFFLPGDTLLFAVGVLIGADTIQQPAWVAVGALSLAALLGNILGYEIGHAAGPKLFARPDSTLFKREHLERAREFFEKYGAIAIILARFVPIVRTFITVVAGAAQLDRRRYFTYSAIGAVIWAGGLTLLGILLGSIPFIADNVEKLVLAAVALTLLPVVGQFVRERLRARRVRPATSDDQAL